MVGGGGGLVLERRHLWKRGDRSFELNLPVFWYCAVAVVIRYSLLLLDGDLGLHVVYGIFGLHHFQVGVYIHISINIIHAPCKSSYQAIHHGRSRNEVHDSYLQDQRCYPWVEKNTRKVESEDMCSV